MIVSATTPTGLNIIGNRIEFDEKYCCNSCINLKNVNSTPSRAVINLSLTLACAQDYSKLSPPGYANFMFACDYLLCC